MDAKINQLLQSSDQALDEFRCGIFRPVYGKPRNSKSRRIASGSPTFNTNKSSGLFLKYS
jgi:hypothetical protein